MSSPYPRPPSEETRPATRFNRIDGLMLTLMVLVAGIFLLLVLTTRLRS